MIGIWNRDEQEGALPSFLIIGTQKGGTSSLHRYLGQHPLLYRSKPKEVHFFDGRRGTGDAYERGLDWYRKHFKPQAAMRSGGQTFESSPLYLFNPLAARRIRDSLPDVKLIAVLRDPAKRAISHYFHNIKLGHEKLPFAQAMDAEEKRTGPAAERGDFIDHGLVRFSYKARGRYAEQLERYFALFDRANIRIVLSDELFGDPQGTTFKLFDFLGVDRPKKTIDFSPRNVGEKKGEIPQREIDRLRDYYRPYNEQLGRLLGSDPGWG